MSTQTSSKEPKMGEIIRFAWGISSLGDFMVAASDKGLVALEFSSDHSKIEEALRVRFQEADVIDGQDRLSGVVEDVASAIEEPGFVPGVPLDLRGTPYQVHVWSMLREIPVGEVTNYGAVAAKLCMRDARPGAEAIACTPLSGCCRCHRAV